jgi:hypothetical protein
MEYTFELGELPVSWDGEFFDLQEVHFSVQE